MEILVIELARLAGARDPEAVGREVNAQFQGYAPMSRACELVIARVHELVAEGR